MSLINFLPLFAIECLVLIFVVFIVNTIFRDYSREIVDKITKEIEKNNNEFQEVVNRINRLVSCFLELDEHIGGVCNDFLSNQDKMDRTILDNQDYMKIFCSRLDKIQADLKELSDGMQIQIGLVRVDLEVLEEGIVRNEKRIEELSINIENAGGKKKSSEDKWKNIGEAFLQPRTQVKHE